MLPCRLMSQLLGSHERGHSAAVADARGSESRVGAHFRLPSQVGLADSSGDVMDVWYAVDILDPHN